jgi:hypothetical protein
LFLFFFTIRLRKLAILVCDALVILRAFSTDGPKTKENNQ